MSRSEIHLNAESLNEVYWPYYYARQRYLALYGGAGSGKSVFAAQKLVMRCIEERGHTFITARKVGRSIRKSQFLELKRVISEWKLSPLADIAETEMVIRFPETGSTILATGLDDVEKLKSISRPSGFWLEEPTELSQEDFKQVDLRLRGPTPGYKQIILTYNPINPYHWLKKRFHDVPYRIAKDGRGRISDRAVVLKTTYRDNSFIDQDDYTLLFNDNKADTAFIDVYQDGEWASPKHIIYSNWDILEWDIPPGEIIYGLDFGFNVPTALVELGVDGSQEVYAKELIYDTRLTNGELIDRLRTLGINRHAYIYADAAEPARIQEIYDAGFNIVAANKSVWPGIDYIKRFRLHIHAESANIEREILGYKCKVDRNDNPLDEPVKLNDHALDAIRYALYSYGLKYLSIDADSSPLVLPGHLEQRRPNGRFSELTKGFTNRY